MKQTKKWIAVLLVLCMTFSISACSLFERDDEEVADPLTRATSTSNKIVLPETMDSTARFETLIISDSELEALQNGGEEGETPETTEGEDGTETTENHTMYLVFNGIANRETDYFYAPTGSLTITARATGESTGMKSFKIGVWEKLVGATQYVPDTTIYFYTNDETNTYTIKGLDPKTPYRINLSYDAYGYYIFGTMQVDNVLAELPPVEEPAE